MDGVRVMIVAESPFSLTLMADLLEANDIKADRCRSVEDAAMALGSGTYNMVVVELDVSEGQAPVGMDRLKGEAGNRDIPVLLVAERSQREAAEQILAGCRTGTVEKPIDTSAFPRKVIEEIRRSATESGSAEQT